MTKRINVLGNRVGANGAKEISEALKRNTSLAFIELDSY